MISKARKLRGFSADAVALQCNVNRSRVYHWEKSRHILPKNLRALSVALRIAVKRLEAENGPSLYKR
jgi:transcriptional regulator with XRE-family HTH domain